MLKNANFLGCLIQCLEFITIFAAWEQYDGKPLKAACDGCKT